MGNSWLIEADRSRSEIYDKRYTTFRNLSLKERARRSVAEAMNVKDMIFTVRGLQKRVGSLEKEIEVLGRNVKSAEKNINAIHKKVRAILSGSKKK